MSTFVGKKPIFRRRYVLLGIFVYVLCFEAYYALKNTALEKLEPDFLFLPPVETVIEPPMRPGVDGIWIIGAPIKSLFFEINPYHAGIRALPWRELPQNTRVKIRCHVDEFGYLIIDNYEIEGHPAAGMRIVETMRTWKYRNLKSGIINFDYKLPSKEEKLTISTRLRRNPAVPDSLNIFDGQLHNITGIDNNVLKIERL